MKNEYYILNNGLKIPKVGFGTWQIPEGEVCYESVKIALDNGYIHIDTASVYGNENSVGLAVRDSKIPREKLFITTKVPATIKNYEDTINIIKQSLELLNLEYIDLLLIHNARPWGETDPTKNYYKENIAVWNAMIEFYRSGHVKAIGVSNFKVHDLENLIANTNVVPTVNQIKYFIGDTQNDIVKYCKKHNILVEAYSPLATGKLLGNPEITKIAKKYNKTLPQIAIKFCLQNEVLPLPKSVTEKYIIENIDLDFTISKEDMDYLNNLKIEFKK